MQIQKNVLFLQYNNKPNTNKAMKNAEKIKQLHEQIDQLQVVFNIKQEQRNQLAEENGRGSWEFSQLTDEMRDINDKIQATLEQIWKLEEEE